MEIKDFKLKEKVLEYINTTLPELEGKNKILRKKLEEHASKLRSILENKILVLYGGGQLCELFIKYFCYKYKIFPEFILDADINKRNKDILGVVIKHFPTDLEILNSKERMVILITVKLAPILKIEKDLKKMGFKEIFYFPELYESIEKYGELESKKYNLLESKKVLEKDKDGVIKLPDFFILGAAKSGTTSIAKYLSEHPEIYIPKEKELHFFLFAENPPVYYENHILGPVLITEFSEYLSFFNLAYEKQDLKMGDCSVTYMYSKGYRFVIKNIKKYYPQKKWKHLKFIAILRNPVERAFSQYVTRLIAEENKPFLEACFAWKQREKKGWSIAYDYLGFSFYYEPLKGYIDAFGKENVKIYLYEDLKNRPELLIKDIFKFLEVDSNFVPPNLGVIYNASFIPNSEILQKFGESFNAKPQMLPETREKLKRIFKEDILKLQDLIGRDLSHWLK